MSNKITLEDNDIYKKLLTQSDLSFSELCSILKKSKVKEMTSLFLKGVFGRKKSIRVEIFLSLFLIFRFHTVVFEGEGTEMDNRLLELVNEIIQIMREDILGNRNTIVKKLFEFKEKFEIWKKMDLNQQVKLYSENYYELELLKLKMAQDNETKYIYIDSIVPLQNKIKNVIKYLAGNKGLEFLENYKTQHLKLTVMLEQKLRENLKKAFWDRIIEDLIEEPPKYNQIVELFKDIQKMYLSITSCIKNTEQRISYENNFKSLIDIEYIELLLNSNGITNEIILTTCANILELVQTIGIPKNDSDIKNVLLKIYKMNNTDEIFCAQETCDIFKFIINLLEEIQRFYVNKMINDTSM